MREKPIEKLGARPVARRDLVLGAAAAFASASTACADDESYEGTWSGFLGTDDPPTLLTLRIEANNAATLTVVGIGTIAVSRFSARGRRVVIETSSPPFRYEGERNGAGDVVGAIQRGAQSVPLTFVRGDFYTEQPMIRLSVGPITAERLHDLRVNAGCPAMGVVWQRRGKPSHILVDGRRSVLSDAPVEATDRWHLGSVTKGMTATLAARLVEQGRIRWRSTIHDVLGDRVPDMRAEYRDVSLLHILSHHGGLARDVPVADYADAPPGAQRIAYVQAALRTPPMGAAGADMIYSNNDYVVVGLMLDTVGEATWEELIAKHVFDPLGIISFGFGPPGAPGQVDQPQGHRMGARGLEPVRTDIPAAMGPAGRVNMSLSDLAIYLGTHLCRPASFLRPASWDTLHTPPFGGDYALGWQVGAGGVLFHGGTNTWWKSEVRVDPSRQLACAAVTNVLNTNGQSALLQLEDDAAVS